MKKLLLTVAAAALLSVPALAQAPSTLSGTGVTCGQQAAATGTSTDTTASTTPATGSSTMALSADNQVTADTARSALTGFPANKDKFASLTAPAVVCIVDLDALAASDAALKTDISGAQANNADIKSKLEANTAVVSVIKAQHPNFDVNKVRAMDIRPNGELVLYVSPTS
jgi:hypothetical protein